MANEITADLTSQLPQPRLITFHWQKTLHLGWAKVVARSDSVSGISCGFFKGEVWSRKNLPPLVELFHRDSKLISFFSSLLCNYGNSAFKLLLSTTFATRKTPSWIWRQLWSSNSKPRSTLWPDSPFRRVFLTTVKLWSTVLWLTVIRRLHREYSGLKNVSFDPCFKVKNIFAFQIFKMCFFLNLNFS